MLEVFDEMAARPVSRDMRLPDKSRVWVVGPSETPNSPVQVRGGDELARMPRRPYPSTYVLPQQGLAAILRQRLDQLEIPVDAGCELDELTQDDRSVTARLTDGRQLGGGG